MNNRTLKKKLIPFANFGSFVDARKIDKDLYIISHDYGLQRDLTGVKLTSKELEKLIKEDWRTRFSETKEDRKRWASYQKNWIKRRWNED